jgi:hypothetical protein
MLKSDLILTNEAIYLTSELIRLVLKESVENPVVKNITAREDFDEYVAKPENRGENFVKEEIDILETLDSKPYKKVPNEIRFSSTEMTNNRNKELAVVKKQGRYIAFFSVRKPTDVSSTTDLEDVPDDGDKTDDRDEIIIKVSRPFSDSSKPFDASLLFNFINTITKEYQI